MPSTVPLLPRCVNDKLALRKKIDNVLHTGDMAKCTTTSSMHIHLAKLDRQFVSKDDKFIVSDRVRFVNLD